ncbi:hypothetical protein P8452_27985 [Trifolium repens]|nr:hypothetical protein P8452_27985 [Trifolium repens]
MVTISDYDVNKETMFDVTRLTSFLEKDDSFLTPWSWDPKPYDTNETNSIKEKQYTSLHPESYFTYQIIDGKSRNNDQVNYNQCGFARSFLQEEGYSIQLMFFTQAPINFRTYSQAWCSVPLMFFNRAPVNFMFPIVIETMWRVMPMPMSTLPQIQNPFVWV